MAICFLSTTYKRSTRAWLDGQDIQAGRKWLWKDYCRSTFCALFQLRSGRVYIYYITWWCYSESSRVTRRESMRVLGFQDCRFYRFEEYPDRSNKRDKKVCIKGWRGTLWPRHWQYPVMFLAGPSETSFPQESLSWIQEWYGVNMPVYDARNWLGFISEQARKGNHIPSHSTSFLWRW
jgi:hypothetical protein